MNKTPVRTKGTDGHLTHKKRTAGGFTLVEVMFASSIALLLFLVLFETLMVCQRMAANVKWRLAADMIAFDTAWDTFNRQLSWFDTQVTNAQAAWTPIASERTSVWAAGTAYVYVSITPSGVPSTNWIIRTNVQWPLPSGGYARLPDDYRVVRYRNDRNLFRATN